MIHRQTLRKLDAHSLSIEIGCSCGHRISATLEAEAADLMQKHIAYMTTTVDIARARRNKLARAAMGRRMQLTRY